jgi:hypothetical protein
VICDGRDLLHLEKNNPFGIEEPHPDCVRFVSILSKDCQCRAAIPLRLPSEGEWFVSVLAKKQRFICGVYRRHMKTIGYLGQIDKLFGTPATTRTWNTILAVARILKASGKEYPHSARSLIK